jgi:N-acetylglucosamine kinase-like BadF-type ATPase
MERYVLGLDGGGTKTQCALFDTAGNKIDIIQWGPTNHEVLRDGFKELKSELYLLFNYLTRRNNMDLNQVVKSVFGIAGVDTKVQHETISEILSEIGFKDFRLCNDAYLGVKAGCSEGTGICIVNGTGCCVAGIDRTGRMMQIGGQGYITGDLGGGAVLGELAISSVYKYLFKCGEYTCIADLLFKELGIISKYSFMDQIVQKIQDGKIKIKDLNNIVFDAANLEDKVALKILKLIGKEMSTSVDGILKELKFDNNEQIKVVLAGSVNLKGHNPTLVNTLKRSIISKNKDKRIKFLMLDKPPVIGAVIWALEDIISINEVYSKFFSV